MRRTMRQVGLLCMLGAGTLLLGTSPATASGRPPGAVTDELRTELATASPQQRVEVCLRLLKEEMASPSVAYFGEGGGPIDSGYLQEVIMGSVCTFAQQGSERAEIRNLLAAKLSAVPASDQAQREKLQVMLGYTGDTSVVPQLLEMLEKHPEGFMRYSALLAIRAMPDDPAFVPVLQRVLENDTYARVRSRAETRWPPAGRANMVYSPARSIASQMLRLRYHLPVKAGADVVDAKYLVPRLEPLLYGDTDIAETTMRLLGRMGGAEAKAALQGFVDKRAGVEGAEALVKIAREALAAADAPEPELHVWSPGSQAPAK